MIRVCRILCLDFFKPGILAWGLIKVAMDTDKTTHVFSPSQKSRRPDRLISGYSPLSFSQIIIFCAVMYQGLQFPEEDRSIIYGVFHPVLFSGIAASHVFLMF
jgi:hypothetical protein